MSLNNLSYKWRAIGRRWAGYRLGDRAARLWRHLKNFRKNHTQDRSAPSFFGQPIAYLVDLFFYLLDLFGVGEIYETFTDFVKYNTRALNERERSIVVEIFGAQIDVDRIRIDEIALAPRFMRIAYVGIYTINSFGRMSEDLFVHELIHIWQYEYQGSVYISRALRAQRSEMGYNYGGSDALKKGASTMLAYNYEQQGDILADYWRAKHKRGTRWKNLAGTVVPYLALVEELKGDIA